MAEKQFPFTLPEDMKKQVEQIANRRNTSMAQVIRDSIHQYVNQNKDQ